MKRRILEKLVLEEISGVDRPCQEGARVAIMKRAMDERDKNLPALVKSAVVSDRAAKSIARAKVSLRKYDPNQARDEGGRWSRVGAAIGRAGRIAGRAAIGAGKIIGTGLAVAAAPAAIALALGGVDRVVANRIKAGRAFRQGEARAKTDHGQESLAFARNRALDRERDTAFNNAINSMISDNKRDLAAARAKYARPPIQLHGPIDRRETKVGQGLSIRTSDFDRLNQPRTVPQVNVSPTKASVPFMITTTMRQDLLDRGYTRAKIKDMTPKEANDILSKIEKLYAALRKANPGPYTRDDDGRFSESGGSRSGDSNTSRSGGRGGSSGGGVGGGHGGGRGAYTSSGAYVSDDRVNEVFNDVFSGGSKGPTSALQDLYAERASLQRARNDLAGRVGEKHPSVLDMNRRLGGLKTQIQALGGNVGGAPGRGGDNLSQLEREILNREIKRQQETEVFTRFRQLNRAREQLFADQAETGDRNVPSGGLRRAVFQTAGRVASSADAIRNISRHAAAATSTRDYGKIGQHLQFIRGDVEELVDNVRNLPADAKVLRAELTSSVQNLKAKTKLLQAKIRAKADKIRSKFGKAA